VLKKNLFLHGLVSGMMLAGSGVSGAHAQQGDPVACTIIITASGSIARASV